MADVLAQNPFPERPGNHTVAIFLDAPPPTNALANVTGRVDEEMELGQREIYVSYGPNMGRSKLKIPAAKSGTARNMNTVAKLATIGSSAAMSVVATSLVGVSAEISSAIGSCALT